MLFFQVLPTSGKITANRFNHGTHGNVFKFIQLITRARNADFFFFLTLIGKRFKFQGK